VRQRRADLDWLPELFATPLPGVERMQWRVDLRRWPEEGEVANPHRANVEAMQLKLKNTRSPSSMFVP
jgi:hypothetical protein